MSDLSSSKSSLVALLRIKDLAEPLPVKYLLCSLLASRHFLSASGLYTAFLFFSIRYSYLFTKYTITPIMTAHIKKPITFSFTVVFLISAVILNRLLLFIILLWYDSRRGAYAHSTSSFIWKIKKFNVIVKLFIFFLFGFKQFT